MEVFTTAFESLGQYSPYIIVVLFIWCMVITGYCISTSRRLGLMLKKRALRLEDGNIGDISDSINEMTNEIGKIEVNIGQLIRGQRETDKRVTGCVQRYGMVRFDAFVDVGGEQSFALALLDDKGTGLVLSNIYGRQDSRMYVKEMVDGQSDKPLSDEEKNAVGLAFGREATRVTTSVR
jgi:hypothetical protein